MSTKLLSPRLKLLSPRLLTHGGWGLNIEEDARVILTIETKARELQAQIDRLEERWDKRCAQLESRRNADIKLVYSWEDVLS